MKKLGYKVYGVNGFRKLRGRYAVPKIKPVNSEISSLT